MYNLAHIYIYEDTSMKNIKKAIELLIKSSKHFYPSKNLLAIALILKYDNNFEIIMKELHNKTERSNNLPDVIYIILLTQKLDIEKNFIQKYRFKILITCMTI